MNDTLQPSSDSAMHARCAGKETTCDFCIREQAPCPDCYSTWYFKRHPKSLFVKLHSPVTYVPIWKRNATVSEKLNELSQYAAKHPEFFDKWILVFCEDNTKRFMTRYECGETKTSDCLAVLQAGVLTLWDKSQPGKRYDD